MQINSGELRNILQNPSNQAIQILADNLAVHFDLQDEKENIKAYLVLLCKVAKGENFDHIKILEDKNIDVFVAYIKRTDPEEFIKSQLLSTTTQKARSGGEESDSEGEDIFVRYGVFTNGEALRMSNINFNNIPTFSSILENIKQLNGEVRPLSEYPLCAEIVESLKQQAIIKQISKDPNTSLDIALGVKGITEESIQPYL